MDLGFTNTRDYCINLGQYRLVVETAKHKKPWQINFRFAIGIHAATRPHVPWMEIQLGRWCMWIRLIKD